MKHVRTAIIGDKQLIILTWSAGCSWDVLVSGKILGGSLKLPRWSLRDTASGLPTMPYTMWLCTVCVMICDWRINKNRMWCFAYILLEKIKHATLCQILRFFKLLECLLNLCVCNLSFTPLLEIEVKTPTFELSQMVLTNRKKALKLCSSTNLTLCHFNYIICKTDPNFLQLIVLYRLQRINKGLVHSDIHTVLCLGYLFQCLPHFS